MCKEYALYHRKTLLNKGIADSYWREHLSSLERLFCKKRLKACVHLAQQDEGWEGICMLFMDLQGREKNFLKSHWQRGR